MTSTTSTAKTLDGKEMKSNVVKWRSVILICVKETARKIAMTVLKLSQILPCHLECNTPQSRNYTRPLTGMKNSDFLPESDGVNP